MDGSIDVHNVVFTLIVIMVFPIIGCFPFIILVVFPIVGSMDVHGVVFSSTPLVIFPMARFMVVHGSPLALTLNCLSTNNMYDYNDLFFKEKLCFVNINFSSNNLTVYFVFSFNEFLKPHLNSFWNYICLYDVLMLTSGLFQITLNCFDCCLLRDTRNNLILLRILNFNEWC